MNRRHALVVAVVLALAAAVAALALVRMGAARTAVQHAPDAVVTQRAHRLDSLEAQLRRELANKPPAVKGSPAASAAPRVRYVRPAPIVHVVHRHGGEGDDELGGRAGDD